MPKISSLALAAMTALGALSAYSAAAQAQTATSAAPAATPAAVPASGPDFDRRGEDLTVRPQDDLFRAANGEWLKNTPIPADKSGFGNFHILADLADQRVKAIVDDLSQGQQAAGSTEQKIASFYRAYMDEAAMDRAGVAPLKPWLDRIAAINSPADLAHALGALQGVASTPLPLDVQPHQKKLGVNMALTWQGGLGLPNRDYYLKADERMAKARAAYGDYLSKLLRLQGDEQADEHAKAVIALETRIATAQWSEVANRDPQKTWNPTPVAQFARLAPGLDWRSFLQASSMASAKEINLSQPSYVKALARIMGDTPLATWRLYLQVRVADAAANTLGKDWRDASFAFHGTALAGQPQQRPRWQQANAALSAALGEAVGRVYVARHFPAANKARMEQLVQNLMAAYRQSIDGLTWMGPATKAQARDKLAKYQVKIGYPNQWRDYSRLEIRDGDPVGNEERAGRFEFERVAAKLNQPVDRSEWGMTPQTVNAYYNPSLNEIVFPAAILQPPFFDMAADDAANYGAIGAVIGHEISHGFDDQGAQFDGDGRLRNWWTPADAKAFAKLGQALVKQYGSYEALPGHFVNGQLTLGENIADLSGLQIAFKAWQATLGGKPAPVINGLSGEQRFFYSFAHAWRGKRREETVLRQITADPHSPEEFRANGTAINHDGFHQAFGTQSGDKLWKPASERVRIW